MGAHEVGRARRLLERCGIPTEGVREDALLARADAIAAAADEYGAGETDAGVLDAHLAGEFQQKDVDATMSTMTSDPYLLHVPVGTGGVGAEEVRRFYEHHFIPAWPADTSVTRVSRTIGRQQVVDEVVVSFTHDRTMDFLLPGIPPTGNRVRLPHAVVVGFERGRVAYEHVYWDQATLLVQTGLLDRSDLPVIGAEQAAKVMAPRIEPTNELLTKQRPQPT